MGTGFKNLSVFFKIKKNYLRQLKSRNLVVIIAGTPFFLWNIVAGHEYRKNVLSE